MSLTTKRGRAEVAKADRPQPRRGASAAANTRNTLNVGDGWKSDVGSQPKNGRACHPVTATTRNSKLENPEPETNRRAKPFVRRGILRQWIKSSIIMAF